MSPDPNLTVSLPSDTPSTGFDPVTGNFNSVQVNYSIELSGSDVTDAFDTVFDIDRDGPGPGGFTDAITISRPAGLTLAGAPYNNSVSFTDVPFGGVAVVRARVDVGNNVDEGVLNEGDNTITRTIATGVPPINMDLTLIPSELVRSGGSVDITYDTNATFSMSCELTGPGLATHSFNPSTDGASGTVTAVDIENKSEYTLTCTELVSGTNQVFTETATIETTGYIEEL
jgi:hypothetical protein